MITSWVAGFGVGVGLIRGAGIGDTCGVGIDDMLRASVDLFHTNKHNDMQNAAAVNVKRISRNA